MDIAERVKAIIADQLVVDIEQVTDSASFIDDLGADFLDTIKLAMKFEDKFKIEIPYVHVPKLTSVLDAVTYLEQRLAEKEEKKLRKKIYKIWRRIRGATKEDLIFLGVMAIAIIVVIALVFFITFWVF